MVLLGSRHSADTLRIKEFLTRNGQPFTYQDVETDPGVQALLDRFHVGVNEVPVVICRGGHVLKNPSHRALASMLGLTAELDPTPVRDVVDRRRRPGRPGGRGVRRLGRARRAGARERRRRAGRPARARASRTTSASRPASRGRRWPGARSRRPRSSAPRSPSAARAVRLDCDSRPYRVHLSDGEAVRTRSDRHRHRRPVPQARSADRSRASRARASTTARRTSRRSSARARRSRSWAAATRPARRRCSCRRLAQHVHDAGARPGAGRQHVALPDPAHRGQPEHRARARAADRGARRRASASSG